MGVFAVPGVRLAAVTAAVPRCVATNDAWSGPAQPALTDVLGIHQRRLAAPDMTALDLCVAAAAALLGSVALSPAEIGALVFVTQTPDHPLPGNGPLAQHRLGLAPSALVLDLHQGCAGYVHGLAVTAAMMSAAGIDRGLLLVGDTITRVLATTDASTVPIFSDAGSATLLERAPAAPPMHFNLGGDGAGAGVISIARGGARSPLTSDHGARAPGSDGGQAADRLTMRGIDVLHYTLTRAVPSIQELLTHVGDPAPDYYVFHQASRLVNEAVRRRLRAPAERVPESLRDFGNTSSATIPVTLCHRLRDQLAAAPTRLLLAGFGAGFSWASAIVQTDALRCAPPLEIGSPDAR
jgi:3-oxoacyl-[acyl-carrier-protein] synthase III